MLISNNHFKYINWVSISFFIIIIVSLTSCKKSDYSADDLRKSDVDNLSIVGKWNTVSYCLIRYAPSSFKVRETREYVTEFKSDGTMVQTFPIRQYDNTNGTWSDSTQDKKLIWEINNNNILITNDPPDNVGCITNKLPDKFDVISHQCIFTYKRIAKSGSLK